jgi:hypothetical protein
VQKAEAMLRALLAAAWVNVLCAMIALCADMPSWYIQMRSPCAGCGPAGSTGVELGEEFAKGGAPAVKEKQLLV